MQDNLEETLQSREQETSRAFSIRSKRGLKAKTRSCKLLQKGRKVHKYLQQLYGDSSVNGCMASSTIEYKIVII